MTIKIRRSHFSGTSKVFSREPDALAAILRGLAVGQAVAFLERAEFEPTDFDFTDNSTGVVEPDLLLHDIPLPVESIVSASGNLGAQRGALNSALDQGFRQGVAVLFDGINEFRALLGLDGYDYSGTVANPFTIPAFNKSVAGANGAASAGFESAVALFKEVKQHLKFLEYAMNETYEVVGIEPVNSALHADLKLSHGALTPADADASGGPASLSKEDADAFLSAVADAVATLAAHWNSNVTEFTAHQLPVVAG